MRWPRLRAIPVTVSVPAVVVLLMVLVGAVASQLVLNRLEASQERQLRDLAGAYLDGLATTLGDPVLRADPWEIFDTLDRARSSYASIRPIETDVTDLNDVVLASSDPRVAPIGSPLPPAFPHRNAGQDEATALVFSAGSGEAFADRNIIVDGRVVGRVFARLDVSPLLAERQDVLWTLLLTNAALIIALAALGWFMVRRMVRPMSVLLQHISDAATGPVVPIPQAQIDNRNLEWAQIFRGFNNMARASSEREALLAKAAEEERLASIGRLASSVAHEINNPLGGILNALDTLRVHGADARVRASSIELVDRGLRGMRDIVRSILATYREDRESRALSPADLEDLLLLVRPEIRRKQLDLAWVNQLPPQTPVSAFAVRQVVLNLLLNACKAAPYGGKVGLKAASSAGVLEIEVSDSGAGLPASVRDLLREDEAEASKLASIGLGLWVNKRIVRELGGTMVVSRSQEGGAVFRVVVPVKHEEGLRVVA